MGLAGRDQGARRRRCLCTSSTTSDAGIAPQAPAPFGFRRRQDIRVVGAPRRGTSTSPASRRLASAPVGPGTRPVLLLRTDSWMAKNDMKEVIRGTPAISDGRVVIRMMGHVYGIGRQSVADRLAARVCVQHRRDCERLFGIT